MLAGNKVHTGTHLHLLRSSGYGLRGVHCRVLCGNQQPWFLLHWSNLQAPAESTFTPVRTIVRDTVTGSSGSQTRWLRHCPSLLKIRHSLTTGFTLVFYHLL